MALSDPAAISVHCASPALLPAKTRAFVDFVADALRRDPLAERFAGSLGWTLPAWKVGRIGLDVGDDYAPARLYHARVSFRKASVSTFG